MFYRDGAGIEIESSRGKLARVILDLTRQNLSAGIAYMARAVKPWACEHAVGLKGGRMKYHNWW
jgi:hypothetical protein